MRFPSIMTLCTDFPDLTVAEARMIRWIVKYDGSVNDLWEDLRMWMESSRFSDGVSSKMTAAWHAIADRRDEMYHPNLEACQMAALSFLIDGYGVEGWACSLRSGVSYINMGDSYIQTIGIGTDGVFRTCEMAYLVDKFPERNE